MLQNVSFVFIMVLYLPFYIIQSKLLYIPRLIIDFSIALYSSMNTKTSYFIEVLNNIKILLRYSCWKVQKFDVLMFVNYISTRLDNFRFDIVQFPILKVKSSYANESYIKIAKLFKCSDIISQLLFILWCNIT